MQGVGGWRTIEWVDMYSTGCHSLLSGEGVKIARHSQVYHILIM